MQHRMSRKSSPVPSPLSTGERVRGRGRAFRPALICIAATLFATYPVRADESDATALARSYSSDIRPLVARYCLKCHSGERIEADVDLAAFATWNDVRRQPKTWQKVGEMLDSGQMPPKEALPPTDAERSRLKQWVKDYLTLEAQSRAGDPGRVVLRRLSNAEYTYTLRDLTGIESLDPAREFPVDGAAGEGFTNTGNALVMSPALVTKYLDAAKDVAAHAVLLPDGFRFSPHTTPRDWTEDLLAQIREFYRQYTDQSGGDKVNLQGIVFDTNTGGRLPLEHYLAATLSERDALLSGRKAIDAIARERRLNAKYLGLLWAKLTSTEPSLLLDGLRARWKTAKPDDAAALAAEIAAWQKGLFRFTTVGHIGKVGGPTRWLEPVSPLVDRQELRFKIPTSPDRKAVTISLAATDAGDGRDHDFVIWQQPRLVAPGRPDLLLRDVRDVTRDLIDRRKQMFANTAKYLRAAEDASAAHGQADAAELAKRHGVDAVGLRAWLEHLGIGAGDAVELTGHFTEKLASAAGYNFIAGWGSHQTPLLLANSSDQHVRVPGNMRPHTVAVHPSPTLRAAVGWRSPVAANLKIVGQVTHAHPECGNGVTWALELRRGKTRQRLATGIAQGSKESPFGPLEHVAVRAGDVVSLWIGPRDGNHACDLTAIDLNLAGEDGRVWNLAGDVSGDVLAGNPHADRFGNAGVWHFYTEPEKGDGNDAAVIPAGSLLAKWQSAQTADERRALADKVQQLLVSDPSPTDGPDAALHRQLTALSGPLFNEAAGPRPVPHTPHATPHTDAFGLDPALFGKHPNGNAIDAASLCVQAPHIIEVRLPADLVAECELVATGVLDPQTGREGSVQLDVAVGKPSEPASLKPSAVRVTVANGQWTGNNRQISYATPILVNDGSAARQRIEKDFDEFRELFPVALCYTKIVAVDEVVTLTQFYREDDHLMRLMLDEGQQARLNRLWDELHYVSRDAFTQVDALAQLIEYATQDADPKVFEPLREPFQQRAAAFRRRLIDSEPAHLSALLDFAAKAYRRPLADSESRDLSELYGKLRTLDMPHEEAFRLTLARVLVSPAFLYRIEQPASGSAQAPVSNWELATRLSYFLWSSLPDDELRHVAAAGKLHDTDTLLAHTRRMLRDPKTRRLATEFACQWLHIYDFDQLDEKSERHFPAFAELRDDMYEESIQFFTHLFQHGGSVLDILDADYTFLNEDLAKHYGIPGVSGPEWRRVDGVKQFGRGGILAQATTLAKQSGASRTSPILRGNWISEVLLGERLPRPPKGVPQLPDDETATAGLTVRQLVEKHSSDAKCAVCHQRIDPLGFALEGFDAIGRCREKDLADRPIETRATTMDGAEFDGLDGLRNYLLTTRRDAFVRQFCKKLLGYALGRAVQLSDEPLLTELQAGLRANDYRISFAVEAIVRSRQFRDVRGRDTAYDE